MTAKATVLVTAAGTIVAQGVIKSLRLANLSKAPVVRYRVVGTDMNPQAAGLYRGDVGLVVPAASSAEYVDSIVAHCTREGVSAIYCGSDEELPVLEAAKERIASESGATVIANTGDAVATGSDKWLTYQFLKENGLPCAESCLPEDWEGFVSEHGLPVVVKPRRSHGSIGFSLAAEREEVADAVDRLNRAGMSPMIQEYLREDGQEFTTGVTSDLSGRIISSIAMRRVLRSGQTVKAYVRDFPRVRKAGREVARKLASIGPLNVQSRFDEGVPKTFEVNPRFSASTPIRAVAGVNEADILYRSWILHEKVSGIRLREIIAMRYWNEVYVTPPRYETVRRSGRVTAGSGFIPDYF